MVMSGAGALTAVKVVGIGASALGAWMVWRSIPESVMRSRLKKLFVDGGLYLKKKAKKKGAEDILVLPSVLRITYQEGCTQVVFNVPDGLDPKEVIKRRWLFEQAFGERIELEGTSKVFVLRIYDQDQLPFEYDCDGVDRSVNNTKLPVYVGRSRSGDIAYDMTEHPHLLVAGETGSGKSVALRSILTTLIRSAGERMELYCADLKRSEFHLFKGIAKQVVVTAPELQKILLKIRKELRRRGDILDNAGLANIDDLPAAQRPPYIVLAIDEVALLKKEKDIMEGIEEISAIGRALGVFLILSMQRPDADVLDGKLKNNLTIRMAFRHSDEINSRITIGSGEAAQIEQSQKGRMVLKLDGIKYVQGPHLSIPTAKQLLAPYKQQEVQEPIEDPEQEDEIELGVL